ncbi:MAG: chorismate-binding protein [Flavobacteriaceae bacterium]|nr:chorismate-binding protein [Flavobacteriaceae bacterium]
MKNDLFSLVQKQFENALPFVAYRKPRQKEVVGILQKTDKTYFLEESDVPGFVMASFDNREKTVLIPKAVSKVIRQEWEETIPEQLVSMPPPKQDEIYVQKIADTVAAIKQGIAQKIVFSRKEILQLRDWEFLNAFHNMLSAYSQAMVYCWYHPQYGLWMGATPEVLCTYHKGYFATMALAGTRFAEKNGAKWGIKEIEEQKMVTDYIVGQLQKQNIKATIGQVQTVLAGNIEHLRTNIGGPISAARLGDLITALHPTPAVCGVPLEAARNYVLEKEGYQRKFYTGYFGEWWMDKDSIELFVNLRCMHVEKQTAALFVGGGITAASNPKLEWEETVQKAQTIKNIL